MKNFNAILNKNDIVEMEITSMTSDGKGVGRVNSVVVFVPETAIGDFVSVKIVKVLKNYCFGKLVEIIRPSQDRCKNECPVFEKCGGCAYRHINYDAEINLKAEQVFHNVSSIGKAQYKKGKPIFNIKNTQRYRNKAQYPIGRSVDGKIIAGFYAPRSHRIISVEDCLLQPQVFSEILKDCIVFFEKNNVSIYDEETAKGLIRHVYIRQGEVSGEIMVCFVVNGKTFTGAKELCLALSSKYEQIKSIVLNVNTKNDNVIMGNSCITLFGNDTINDEICGIKTKLSPLSFYQVNHYMAQELYTLAGKLANLNGTETVLDLYCGAGLIGLSVAKKVKKLVGIEIVEDAVKNAKENAKLNGIANAEFFCGDASYIQRLLDKGYKFDVIFVDPPRKGCSPDVIDALINSGAKKIVMISCNSSTMARDLMLLSDGGYKADEIIPADLFPRTVHCEAIALLQMKGDVHKMKLNSTPFEMIKSGEKTIELRLYDEKRQQINVGDKIIFINNATGEKLNTTVVKLHIFDTFNDLYKSMPLLKCGYTTEDINTAHPSDMEQYYSVEEQKKYGVVGIELVCS